jgi:ubiquinone/menaquinone biosynthesis C-methylase UbiE
MIPLDRVLAYKRYIRYLFLNKVLNINREDSVIDVGCGELGRSYEVFNTSNKIVGTDIFDPDKLGERLRSQPNFGYIQCDAADMSIFADSEFDAAICIGMLEHITDKYQLLKISNEIRRVARKYAVCVPWRYTPIEPHFKLPFFQLYPETVQYKLISRFNLHGLGERTFDYFKSNYQWLSAREWKEFFPECRVSLSPTIFLMVIYGKTD